MAPHVDDPIVDDESEQSFPASDPPAYGQATITDGYVDRDRAASMGVEADDGAGHPEEASDQ